jgi:OmpA-OmpF porin, OOP family
MRTLHSIRFTILATAVSAALPGVALAQEPSVASPPGFALNRFNPADRGSDWFALDSLDMRGHLRPAIGLVGEWGYRPLVYYNANDEAQTDIVRHQLFGHFGASLTLWDALRVGLTLPVALYNSGDSATVNGINYVGPSGVAVGDLRLSGTVRFYGDYESPFSAALGVQLFLPTGRSSLYTGDAAVRGVPSLNVAGTISSFVYAARLGAQFRPTAAGFEDGTGTEVQYAASAGVRVLEGKLTVGPELFGNSVVTSTGTLQGRQSTSIEAVLGAHYALASGLRLGLGAGAGLAKGYGTPTARVLGTIEWALPYEKEQEPQTTPAEPDRDHDGIADSQDACPDDYGVASEDPRKHGCPVPPSDLDNDGIVDAKDACPREPGLLTNDPKTNGCPPPPSDRDKDGILDKDDACPDEPGVKSEDPKRHGCPLPKDTDKDGILDHLDACPTQAGPPNADPKKHGCPVIEVKGATLQVPPIFFDNDKDTIKPDSELILFELQKFLKENPGILKLSIEGHTDNKGTAVRNKDLSNRRAAAVVKWLVARGVDKNRLASKGFGQDKPLETNDTEEGRAKNRRVEYIIVKQEGK